MKLIVIEITSCTGCSYKEWTLNGQERICRKANDRVIEVPLDEIPTWCPLDNIEISEEGKEYLRTTMFNPRTKGDERCQNM